MPEAMVMHDFGSPKIQLMGQFQQGLEMALGRANLLRTTKIETMQAFVMYLVGRSSSRIFVFSRAQHDLKSKSQEQRAVFI